LREFIDKSHCTQILVTTNVLANLLKVEARTVRRYASQGMPVAFEDKAKGRYFDIVIALEWYRKNINQANNKNKRDSLEFGTVEEVDIALKTARKRKLDFEYKVASGKYISINDVETEVVDTVNFIQNSITEEIENLSAKEAQEAHKVWALVMERVKERYEEADKDD
jgi:phage terminase Nu1 subunit (DNA packaging protein)